MIIKCIVNNAKERGETIVSVCLEQDMIKICTIQSLVKLLYFKFVSFITQLLKRALLKVFLWQNFARLLDGLLFEK